ncbi:MULTISPECIES: hypothetical protein [unclassified Microcoleus]|uniref:hypothetical protein n=1 Tax=unclassified Microcoleus TaxID=2642155 RepID=UPI002FD4FD39
MVKQSAITQADIKVFLARQVKDDVRQFRRERALDRINLLKAVGVGNMDDYISEWEQDFANSITSPKLPEPKNKKLKKITNVRRDVRR